MEPFLKLNAVAAPYDRINVDTDQILPARFLMKRRTDAAYPTFLFRDLRFNSEGIERPEFVLNQPAYRHARIFVANANFGGGSAREAAAFAFDAYGIRCIIAVSFGDVFYSSCIKNGILPIALPEAIVSGLREQLQSRPGSALTIDLPAQTVTDVNGNIYPFEIDAFRKNCLEQGLSQITLTLQHRDTIDAFEKRYRETMTWS